MSKKAESRLRDPASGRGASSRNLAFASFDMSDAEEIFKGMEIRYSHPYCYVRVMRYTNSLDCFQIVFRVL